MKAAPAYSELQYRLAEEYGGIGLPDADGELVNMFVMLAADEGQYNIVVSHAILKGLDNWKAKTIEQLHSPEDRAYVKSLLRHAGLQVADKLGTLNGKVIPPKDMALAFIAAIDEVVGKEMLERTGVKPDGV